MSDDLISRKAVLDILTEERIRNSILASPAFGEMLAQRIKNIPTAFDKEKTIDQLKEEGCIIDDEAGNRAVEIIEKGGLN